MIDLLHPDARLLDAVSGDLLGGEELQARVGALAGELAALPPGVLFHRCAQDVPGVLGYVAAFTAGRAVAMIDPSVDPEIVANLVERFHPAAVLNPDPAAAVPDGYTATELGWTRTSRAGITPHPDLAVVLPTSGSTGNPKFVRLSRNAVLANASAIAEALRLTADEVAPTSLPLNYSYGLSVLNSHLLVGATVLVEGTGIMSRTFWTAVTEHRATSLAGVPYHYEMLRKLKFDPARYPSLRTLTQAGGKLAAERIAEFAAKMHAVGGQMFVMYGQTEATARMAVLPAERVLDKLGSAGRAIPGGSFTIHDGEVFYYGPNVMMGYAENAAELAEPDQLGGTLATGDLGHLDDEGYLWITGRLKRIGKVFGNRVNLDDVEQLLKAHGVAAAVPGGDKIVIWLEGGDAESCRAVAKHLSERLHQHISGFDVHGIDTLPLLSSGKIDYRALEAHG
jgi:acyl-coenzyme A synthetase/AMP-(fatty) acid ligase